MSNCSQWGMIDIEFKYCEFPTWFVLHVEGRDTSNVSTETDCIVKPPILYTREFTEEEATMNFLQFEPALLRLHAY